MAKDRKADEVLTIKNVRAAPAASPPKYLDSLLGLAVRKDIKAGTYLYFELLK